MPLFRDQLGRDVHLEGIPQRIISLVPSLTELICDLGCEDRIKGITSFCVHPEHIYRSVLRVGGTKNFRQADIDRLKPDLIIANKEENPKHAVMQLADNYPVWVSDVHDIHSALHMIESLGALLDATDRATFWRQRIESGFENLRVNHAGVSRPKVLYLIWKNPYMVAGSDTFISDVLDRMGFENMMQKWGSEGLRYPKIEVEQIVELRPDFLLLSSEPYPFKSSEAVALSSFCEKQALLVDGEALSWYGSRLARRMDYLGELTAVLHKK